MTSAFLWKLSYQRIVSIIPSHPVLSIHREQISFQISFCKSDKYHLFIGGSQSYDLVLNRKFKKQREEVSHFINFWAFESITVKKQHA